MFPAAEIRLSFETGFWDSCRTRSDSAFAVLSGKSFARLEALPSDFVRNPPIMKRHHVLDNRMYNPRMIRWSNGLYLLLLGSGLAAQTVMSGSDEAAVRKVISDF